jgi:hypothetical protein
VGTLAASLNRIVRDPAQVHALHEVLGPFCHESRNLLNSLKMSLYLAQREEPCTGDRAWSEVEKSYHEIENLYDRLQIICRPISLACVRMSLSLLLEDRRKAWVDRLATRGGALELVAPGKPDVGDYDPNCLGRALDAFVSWRAEAAEEGRSARLSWSTRGGSFHLEWVESEPGTNLASGDGGGVRRESVRCEPLALPFLGRIITAHGGSLVLVKPSGGHIRLSWPQVVRLPQ